MGIGNAHAATDTTPTTEGWTGKIYAGKNFDGKYISYGSTKPLSSLNFDWGYGSPGTSIPKDYFSSRFSSKWDMKVTGIYKMDVWADTRVRVYVDNKLVINSWKYVKGNYRTVTIPLKKGQHTIKVEHYEHAGKASLKFKLSQVQPDYQKTVKAPHYDWKTKGPVANKYDHFTAKFDQSQNLAQGDYFIQTHADNGVFMDVNGQVKIDRWKYSKSEIVSRALLTGVSEGPQSITTLYNEGGGSAHLFSDIVPFGDWLAYYYPNTTFGGYPDAANVIKATGQYGNLSTDNDIFSPVPGTIPNDNFSVKYVTAKRITAGDYLLRAKADDGVQVYIDGKLVLDNLNPRISNMEENKKITIKDTSTNGDIHWMEVKYIEKTVRSNLDVFLQPYSEVVNNPLTPSDGWIGEVFDNKTLSGTPTILGGKLNDTPIEELDFDWAKDAPSNLVPVDNYSTRFTRVLNIENDGYYILNALADDGVRVYVDGKKELDSWKYQTNPLRQARVYLTKGEHKFVVEHFDGEALSHLKFYLEKAETHYTKTAKSLHYNWGTGSPHITVQPDYFTATFDQSQSLASGDYFLQTYANSNVSVDVNGNTVIKQTDDSRLSRAVLPNVTSGEQKITTNFSEGTGIAYLFSDVVPFGNWLAYYYANESTSGVPAAAKVIKEGSKFGELLEEAGYESPAAGVPKDHFSAKYATAKRISAGDYVLRSGANEGIQVYVDGKLVIDHFSKHTYAEDSVRLTIEDRADAPAGQQDVHWIEVRHKDVTGFSKVNVFLQKYTDAKNISVSDGWFGEFYSNTGLTGPSVIMGGKGAIKKVSSLNYNWKDNAPSAMLPEDKFSARFTKKLQIDDRGKYAITVHADNGVRVYLDGKMIIDSWKYISGNKRQAILEDLSEGVHDVVVEYYEYSSTALLKFEIDKVVATSFIEVDLRKPANITAKEIEAFFDRKSPGSSLKQYAQDFIDVQNKSGVNAQYLVAHAIWETGWGKSTISIYKRNFFGYGAYDSCPVTCAYYFPTGFDSVNFVAYKVKTDYLSPTGTYYNGSNLIGMNVRYATDQNWKNGISSLMQQMKPFDAQYYQKVKSSTIAPAKPGTFSRNIPSGQPKPTNIFLTMDSGVEATVNTEGTNFRNLPYVSSSTLISSLKKGTSVYVIGYHTDVRGDWYRVKVGDRTGWLSNTYIDIQNLLKIKGVDSLNVRSGAGTSYSVLKSVKNDTYLKMVLSDSKPVTKNGWYQVYLPKSTTKGWVSDDYVSVIK